MSAPRKHAVSVVVEGQQIFGWIEYEVSNNMLEPSDSFSMSRPWSQDAWTVLRRDARIKILIDGTQILDGFIEDRTKHAKDGTFELSGRSRASRLVAESAPAIDYSGLEMSEAILRLCRPWFTVVTLSDARNRSLRTGKGWKVPVGEEPIVLRKIATRGEVHPGQSRWSVIEEILSGAGLMGWASADGREFFIGRPIRGMAPQFAFRHCKPGGVLKSTVKDLVYKESNGDRFSLIATVGTGGGSGSDFGYSVSNRRAFVLDNDTPVSGSGAFGSLTTNAIDGTGRDFLYPKRLLMPETNFDSIEEARTVARREQIHRDFNRTALTVSMPFHGQWIGPGNPTIFAPNTIASVLDEDFEPAMDENYLIHACTFSASRDAGETTMLELVPDGTEVLL